MKEVKPSKKPLAIYYAIVLLVLLVLNLVFVPWLTERQVKEVDYGTFMSMTAEKQIGKVDIQSNQIVFTDKEEKQIYKTGLMNDPGLTQRLYDAGAQFSSEIVEQGSPVLSFLLWFVLPILLFSFIGNQMNKKLMEKAGGGPGAKHAAVAVSLIVAVAVGYLTQRTRFCMIAGIRDFILFKETKMLWGFVAVVAAAAACNVVLTSVTGGAFFKLGFAAQPIAHTDALWNVLGLFLAGFACVLLGGCPMRQLVLSGEGNSDSAVTLLGFIVGAAFAHNFGLASSGNGPTANGQIAVVIGIIVVTVIAYLNTYKK